MITYNTTKDNFLKAVNKYKKVSIYIISKRVKQRKLVCTKKKRKEYYHPSVLNEMSKVMRYYTNQVLERKREESERITESKRVKTRK